LPLITAPLAVMSVGSFFVQGLLGSGWRRVAKIFTTEFSTAFEGVAAGGDKTTTGEGFASGVGVTGSGLVSAGAAKAAAIVGQKIKEAAKGDVMAKTRREVRSILIGQRNSFRERKRASFSCQTWRTLPACGATWSLAWLMVLSRQKALPHRKDACATFLVIPAATS